MPASTSTPTSSSSSHLTSLKPNAIDTAANLQTSLDPIPTDTTATDATSSDANAIDTSTNILSTPIQLIFALFSKLPPELRIRSSELVREPRIIVFRFTRDGRKTRHKFVGKFPAVLHACQESRHEWLKHYQKAFDSKWALNGVYFNFDWDILCFSWRSSPSQEGYFMRRIKVNDCTESRELLSKLGTSNNTDLSSQGLRSRFF